MHFASFLSGGFITAIVVNLPERKPAKRTSVHWITLQLKVDRCVRISNLLQQKMAILNLRSVLNVITKGRGVKKKPQKMIHG